MKREDFNSTKDYLDKLLGYSKTDEDKKMSLENQFLMEKLFLKREIEAENIAKYAKENFQLLLDDKFIEKHRARNQIIRKRMEKLKGLKFLGEEIIIEDPFEDFAVGNFLSKNLSFREIEFVFEIRSINEEQFESNVYCLEDISLRYSSSNADPMIALNQAYEGFLVQYWMKHAITS